MDERHWWIAQHIGHVFKIDLSIQANNSFMEKFILDAEVLEKVNGFLCMNGSNKLFFCCLKNELEDRNILTLDSLLKIPKHMSQNVDNVIILYFLRHDTNQEISQAYIHKEVYCGEIKNVSNILFNIYNDLLLPSFKANKDWGSCSDETKTQIVHNMEKYVNTIGTILHDNQGSKSALLKKVENPEILNELKQPRLTLDSPVIKVCEEIALDWIRTIENILSDICDERFIHPSVGPLSELERWQRKQRLLANLTEQLKSKECKSIISGLISVKSKVLKKWKAVDSGITDSQNECRDKVKFLESLKRPIDQFYQDVTPHTCINTAIPNLCTSMRTIESVSRYYARQGYLGLLFTKVTNQIVNILKEYISELAIIVENDEQFWPILMKEVEENVVPTTKEQFATLPFNQSPDKQHRAETVRTVRTARTNKTKDSKELEEMQLYEGLYARLKNCLYVQAKYKEAFRNLRDGLGGTQALSSFPSVSSLHTSDQSSLKDKDSAPPKSKQTAYRRTNNDSKNHGILMSEEDVIFSHIDAFCTRAKNMIDQMTILSQYQNLAKTTLGLSRPKREDLGFGDNDEENENNDEGENTSEELNDSEDDLNDAESFNEIHADSVLGYFSKNAKNMDPVLEEEAEEFSRENSSVKFDLSAKKQPRKSSTKAVKKQINESDLNLTKTSTDKTKTTTTQDNETTTSEYRNEAAEELFKTENRIEEDTQRILKKSQTLSKEDLRVLKKYYNKSNEFKWQTVTTITNEYLLNLINFVKTVNAKFILDVETKDATIFDEMHKNFSMTVANLERFLAAYLNVIFLRDKATQDGLNILTRFEAVNQRNILRPIINDKYAEMFTNYDRDLEETIAEFEQHKTNPPLLRNAPPVAGAISWVRTLLKNIEEPIKTFQSNKYIANLGDFTRIARQYNKVAAVLIAFETYYLNLWKSTIEEAKLGLKAHLLLRNDRTMSLIVNYDPKLLLLFHEAKALKRLHIEIPNQAQEILNYEKKYKDFKINLELLYEEFEEVKARIPKHLASLYEPHIKQALDVVNPGCYILTWSSLNIDAFLKQFEVAVRRLQSLVAQIQDMKEKEILDIIEDINTKILFDKTLAFSKRWSPDDFTNMINESIVKIGEQLTTQIKKIETNIEDITRLLLNIDRDGSNENTRRKGKSNIYDLRDSEPKIIFLREFYSINLYDAIYNCVKNSLHTLAVASGYKFDLDFEMDEFENDDAVKQMEQSFADKSIDFENDERFKNIYLTSRSKSVVSTVSHSTSAKRPLSNISALSKVTWSNERKVDDSYLSLELTLKYSIPEVAIEPDLRETEVSIKTIAFNCIETARKIKWKHPENNKSFYDTVCKNPDIIYLLNIFNSLTEDLRPVVKQHVNHFKLFDFLWQEDLNNMFNEFMKYDPGEAAIKREVERLVRIEKKVLSIPEFLTIGPVCLKTEAIKNSLKSFAFAWKSKYASILHQFAKTKLQSALVYRENVQKRLSVNVQTLEQLNDALRLLEELSDMENKIDKIYLPIENLYDDLRRFDLLLTREEIEQVTSLREKWADLMKSAENARVLLLQEKRNALEQELDKQVKTFVVEVIRFRNAFDAQGPSVASIEPLEAVRRLADFQKQYDTYDTRRKTLDSISILFGLQCKPFPELDKTGEELVLLNLLYKVYQKFLTFDKQFRATLWSDVDLVKATNEINTCWQDFNDLPIKLKENWDAYTDLKNVLQKYIDVLPILSMLNAKEIRNRHWLQVMSVTKSSFQLESAIFKLNDLVDIGLDLQKNEIVEICKAAKKEQELETKMRTIEEEWNEQVLSFLPYKDYGEVCLDKFYTERLLEQLDDAQESLVSMLTSKYIGPLRDEVSSWSEKLKTIGEVLDLWLEVQELWVNNEAVFTNQSVVKEMTAEVKRFTRVDKAWLKSQKQSFDMKSVLQCCLGSSVQENTKRVLLKDFQKELEINVKSLGLYLEKKRRLFPRFYFLSNSSLLTLLSHPNDITSTKPYLSSIFSSIYDIKLEEIRDEDEKLTVVSSTSLSQKRSTHLSDAASNLNLNNIQYEATEVLSIDGEFLQLHKKISIEKNVDVWLGKLKDTIAESLKRHLLSALTELQNNSIQVEELAMKYPTQICIVALNYLWTKEAELSIYDIKNDRKSVNAASKKFIQVLTKLLTTLTKSKWASVDRPILFIHKLRLETMLGFCTYLKDAFEELANRRVRDIFDFEWQRCFRVYLLDENEYLKTLNEKDVANSDVITTTCSDGGTLTNESLQEGVMFPRFSILDDNYNYGSEFYGVQQTCVITSLTERSFLSMWQATRLIKGSLISGNSNSGKTQTVKGLAQFMGRYLGYMYCTAQTDQQALGNYLVGFAQEGSWGLFDEIQNLNSTCLSWFNEYLSAILHSLRKKGHMAILGDGKDIQINHHFSIFSTLNPLKFDSYVLPIQVRSMFRVISMLEPDTKQIIWAKCAHYGIKCGHILAARIKTLHEICQSTFTSFETKNQLTITNFLEIIKSIYEKQRPTTAGDSRPETSISSANQVQLANKYVAAKGELLTAQITPLKELSRKNKTTLLNYAKSDHMTIAQIITDVITPRLNTSDAKSFKKIVQDIFNMAGEGRAQQQSSISNNLKSLERIIMDKATNEHGLTPNKNWVEKCLQIYSVSNVYRGIILVGPPCSGKSSTLGVLIESLTDHGRASSARQSHFIYKTQNQMSAAHKLRKINPLAIDDESLLYGSVLQNGDWKDGLITHNLKRINRMESTSWLCLDGPIFPNWSDNFNTIIDSEFLQLKNGDRLMTQSKFVFETSSLADASPSIVSKSGIVFYGEDLVGWRSIAKSWLDLRKSLESQKRENLPQNHNMTFSRINQCLHKILNKTMDDVIKYVLVDCKPILPVREEGLFISCLSLLGAMLSENNNISGEMHIERLYLYCLIWTYGGVLETNDQKGFSDLLNKLVSSLPDDDQKSSVFEYYVDESGEWDLWSAKVPETQYLDNMDLLGNLFVETTDTIRCKVFLELANLANLNIVMIGSSGCGKTTLIQDFIQDLDATLISAKRLNFSSATNVSQVQKFIEANIVHRQGYTYGAPDKKKFMIFIDDINLPQKDKYGVQRCNEFLRQVVDGKFIYGFSKPFEMKKLENVALYSTMTFDKNTKEKSIDPRFLRYFIILNLPNPKGQVLKSIFNGVLEATFLYNNGEFIEADLHSAIVDSSCHLIEQIVDVLKPSPTPGRAHYLFNMRQMITILQNLRKLSNSQRADANTVVSLWRHEIFLTIGDQIPRLTDQAWLQSIVTETIKEKLKPFYGKNKLTKEFITFSLEERTYDRPSSSLVNRNVRSHLSPLDSIEKARSHIEQACIRYKEEFGSHQINLSISENIAKYIIRIHRVLSFSHGGNLLLIGTAGNRLRHLIKLAVYLADIQVAQVDCAKISLFYDSIRASVRAAGAEGRPTALIFSSQELEHPEYLDTINSLLNNGECLHLFSNDEMDGLYQAIGPSIKREYPNIVVDPKKFFNTRVKKNLHICVAITPHSKIFSQIVRDFTSIVNNSQFYWICDWDQDSLLQEAKFFMRGRLESEELRNKISETMSDIHFYMLKECRQIPWAGSLEKDIKITQTKIVEKKKEQLTKTITISLPNWPYSKNILMEQIKLEHVPTKDKSKLHFFIGPNTFRKLMNTFWYFFTTKAKQCENDIIRLRRVLDTLTKTRNDAKEMKVYIKDLKNRVKQSEIDSDQLLTKLIEKTTAVEKLKAKFGRGGSLATLMQMHENINETFDADGEKLLLMDEIQDEYDQEFAKMKEESMRSKQTKLLEDLESAKQVVEDCKRALTDKRRLADYWRNKVDRPCIERIRAFQNPPALIGQIMEMTMIMIGKRKPIPFDKPDTSSAINTSRDRNDPNSTQHSNSVLEAKTKPKPPNNKMERLDKAQWKLYQGMMQDASKFVEVLHDINLEDGLFTDVCQAVESYLAKGKEGQLGVTGEGFLLETKEINISASKGAIDQDYKGITVAAARYASEDAATLVHYVIAVIEYTRQCGPLRSAKEKVEMIKAEITDYERKKSDRENEDADESIKQIAEDSYNETDLPRLTEELQILQDKFDAAAVKKHKLHIELETCIQRLDAATAIIQSLTNLEEQWKKWIDEHLSHEQTLTNCLIAGAFMTYSSSFDSDLRKKFCKYFVSVCSKLDIPKEPQQVFRDLTLAQFLYTPIQLKELQLLRLPDTENMMENGCYIIEDKCYDNWPLFCDSSRRSIDWIRTFQRDKTLFVVRHSEIKSVLETCLSEGQYLLLTDCNVNNIMNNPKLEIVLKNKHRFINSEKPFKLNLGTQEVECKPSFRLFLHTIYEAIDIPIDLSAFTTVITYTLTRYDVEEEMLDRFMKLAKPRIDNERYTLLQEKVDTLKIIDPLEQDITDFLASDVNLLNSVEPTKKLSDLKKMYDEAVDSNLRIEAAEESLIKTRESYREIAQRASVCYDVISSLKEINPNYILSYQQFSELFDDSLYQFERSSIPQVVNKLTFSTFNKLCLMLTEHDKKVYAILLAMEIEAISERINPGEKEFIVSPSYCAAMMQTTTGKQMVDHRHYVTKKPFDWMSEDQFANLQILAIYFNWFGEFFERMSKDGRETYWRSLCETEYPENAVLPDKLDDQITPTQRLCVIRAVRGDRILQACLAYVNTILGKNYTTSINIDLEALYENSSATKPIVLMYLNEPETIRRCFLNFVRTRDKQIHTIIDINGVGTGEEKNIKKLLAKPIEEGSWVLLHNCQNAPQLLNQLETIINDNTNSINQNFRCWISLLQSDTVPPSSLMLNSVKSLISPPTTMKENMIRGFSWVDHDLLRTASKSEWPALLHNICYLHSCLKLRSRYSKCGWNIPYSLDFTTEELLESFKVAAKEFSYGDTPSRSESAKSASDTSRTTSWPAIKYILSELIYGSMASDEGDLEAIKYICEQWISPSAVRKEYELAKVKYKIPAQFLVTQPRLNTLQQALENLPHLLLELPEACHLLPSTETVLGDDLYIMTRLNRLIDIMPSSRSNVKVYDRPLTPFEGPNMVAVNSSSNNPLIQSLALFSSAAYVALQSRKMTDLSEYCANLIIKIPKGWTKDQVNDRIKKAGGPSTYNTWLANEMNALCSAMNIMKHHLTIIKNATAELKLLGCTWDDDIVKVADSLYYQKIPDSWAFLSGVRHTIHNVSVATFIAELGVRFTHIERCITLGRDKNPAFNLSAFYNPQVLLGLMKLETLRVKNQNDETFCVESLVFQTEMTTRDKEHLRDPPKEGIFIFGLNLWGCHFEKGSFELVDQTPKNKEVCISLPLITLTCWPESEKPFLNDANKVQDLYACPVYISRNKRDEKIFSVDMWHSGVVGSKWAMRGVCATLRPY